MYSSDSAFESSLQSQYPIDLGQVKFSKSSFWKQSFMAGKMFKSLTLKLSILLTLGLLVLV